MPRKKPTNWYNRAYPSAMPIGWWRETSAGDPPKDKIRLFRWEIPRLCRGGRRSLTFSGVCFARLLDLKKTFTCTSTSTFASTSTKTVIVDVHVLVDVAVDGFGLRSGPFEGPATIKPPALPGDTYYISFAQPARAEARAHDDLSLQLAQTRSKRKFKPPSVSFLPRINCLQR